jgi:hypothetical protein
MNRQAAAAAHSEAPSAVGSSEAGGGGSPAASDKYHVCTAVMSAALGSYNGAGSGPEQVPEGVGQACSVLTSPKFANDPKAQAQYLTQALKEGGYPKDQVSELTKSILNEIAAEEKNGEQVSQN